MPTDISSLLGKVENGGTSGKGKATAAEWNMAMTAIQECQGAVKSVSINGGTAARPDEQGHVNLVTTDGSTRYTAQLSLRRDNSLPIVTTGEALTLGVRYTSVMVNDDGRSNASIDGTLYIYLRRTRDAAFGNPVAAVTLRSRNENAEVWDEIDASQYITANGEYVLRLSVEYDVTDNAGNVTQHVVSVNKDYDITRTRLSLEYAGQVAEAWAVVDNQLTFEFHLMGEVQRELHVKVTGSSGVAEYTYTVMADEATSYATTFTRQQLIDSDTAGLLTHGVKTIEAWLTCADGAGGQLESRHVTAQRMVVVDTEDTTPRLLVQDMAKEVTNYVATTLCRYLLFSPSGESLRLVMRVADYYGQTDYFRLETLAEANTMYDFPATVEIEDGTSDTLYAYFDAKTDAGVAMWPQTSVRVDNSERFAPTLGAHFLLNPKTRNNGELHPETIVNAMTGEAIAAEFDGFDCQSDLWVKAGDGQRVLRVLAGERITMDYDWLQPFATNNAANVTLELDYKVSNVTDESAPVIEARESYGDSFIGLRMLPLELTVYTKGKHSYQEQNLMLAEDVRTHVSINIVSALRASTDEDAQTLSLCRVFVNGVICREFQFDASKKDWYDLGTQMVIGSAHADIDIYSLRCYRTAVSASGVLQNYMATLPTAAEKVAFRQANAILGSDGKVSASKCKDAGKSVLTWHGVTPSHANSSDQTGWWEIARYDRQGNLLPQHSGTICKATKSLVATAQGSTAKTYHDFNLQTKLKGVTQTIVVAMEDLHEDISVGTPYVAAADNKDTGEVSGKTYVKLFGCGMGKNDWSSQEARRLGGALPYEKQGDKLVVPDGWVDGNGKYRGKCYQLSQSSGYGQKLVNKINYASAMQSHLMGGNKAYHDLHSHADVVGPTGLQLFTPTARTCKEQDVFLFFAQGDGESEPVYMGPCTFGPGKMDDASMGYDKKQFPKFAMVEGSDNNLVLTDFRTPWESRYITWEADKGEVSGVKYNNVTMLDLDRYSNATETVGGVKKDATVNVDGQSATYPNDDIMDALKELVNFLYLHSPRLRVYVGTWSGFLQSQYAQERSWKWWCTQGDDAYKLRRYDEVEQRWVEAGWNDSTEQNEVVRLNDKYPGIVAASQGQWETINKGFIGEIAAEAKAEIADYMSPESLKFHYCYVNQLEAGTDNCSKNTYLCYVPKDTTNTDYWWVLYQDDVDTIKATDNSGYQNKPYYIDRQHAASDLAPDTDLYQGMGNVLFDLCQAMYEDTGELREMFKKIFTAMTQLAPSQPTLMGFQEEYFFSTQRWIPAVAYNEAARIRYELPTLEGFVSDRGVNPITQSCGSQLLAETEFMKKRLVLFASYAAWGDFYHERSGSTGVDGASDVLPCQGMAGSNHYVRFTGLVPHQYMYISGRMGQTTRSMGVRCKPGVSYDFDLTGSTPLVGDTACSLFGLNFFRSIGNIGHLSITDQYSYVLTARRLTEVTITPADADGGTSDFRAPALTLNTPLVKRVTLNGSAHLGGDLDLSGLTRLQAIDTRGTRIGTVHLPRTKRLEQVELGDGSVELVVEDLPSLRKLTLEGYANLRKVSLKRTPSIDSFTLATRLYEAQPTELRQIALDNVSWSGAQPDFFLWVASKAQSRDDLQGQVTLMRAAESRYITLAEKLSLVAAFGNIDSAENALHVSYDTRAILSIGIYGDTFPYEVGAHRYEVTVSPKDGNDVACTDDGAMDMSWSLPVAADQYAHFTDGDGTLMVTSASAASEELRQTITLRMKKMDGTELTATKSVGFYRRVPKVGDFAYGDGTFDEVWDEQKDCVGIVFMRLDKREEEILTGVDLRVVMKENCLSATTSDKSEIFKNFTGGININTGTTGFTETEIQDINDAAGVGDASTVGTRWSTSVRVPFSPNKGADEWTDDSTDDGFKVFTGQYSIMNDFGGKEKTAMHYEHVSKIITLYFNDVMPTTLTELADIIKRKREANTNTGDSKNRDTQPFFPAIIAPMLYEPVHVYELADEYKKGQWYSPAFGELARLLYYSRFTSDSPSSADFNSITPERAPIYANANSKAGRTVVKKQSFSTTYCSTEGTNRGRHFVLRSDGWNTEHANYGAWQTCACAKVEFTL